MDMVELVRAAELVLVVSILVKTKVGPLRQQGIKLSMEKFGLLLGIVR